MKEGRGPIIMDTPTALANLAKNMTPKEVQHLLAEAWEDFLDMTISQCGIWAGENIEPDKKPSEIMPTEPYLLGSHAGCAGIWVSGPTDVGAPKEWSWGYRSMTTVKGLFTAGDGVGASGHKFSSGSHAEGRMAAKGMIKFVMDNKDWKPEMVRTVQELVDEIYRPVKTYLEHKDYTTAIDINPHYITPKMLQFRLQKIMDEYCAGVSTWYQTNGKMLEICEQKLEMLKEDSPQDARQGPARVTARVGELPPHPRGRGAHEAHPVPRGNPLSGLLLPRGLQLYRRRELEVLC